jgi:hypothetical protein
MSRVFLRKQFSNYLGENRAIDDIIVRFIADGPSPSPTPVPVTPTPTPTPSITPSITPSVTPTRTLTPTPTKTSTPTPTRTPAPACDITYTELPSPTPSPTPTITPTASPGPAFDPDAAAYLSAVVSAGGTTSPTISAATNTLFIQLKGAGLYSKTTMMYPYIGSTSASHSLEAKNPGTNNISFNVVSGSWIHNLSGATPGTQCWATNNVYLNTASTLNNVSLFTYLGTDNFYGGDYCIDFGTTDDLGVNGVNALIGGSSQPDPTSYFYNNDGGATRITISSAIIPNSLGFFGYNRTTSTNFNVWGNGVKLATDTDTNTGILPSLNPLYMPAPNNVILYVNKWTTRRHQFDWVGQGLTDGEAANLSTIINIFQTSLGRNTY